jgi:hypothetical protein
MFTDFIEDIVKSQSDLIEKTGPNNAVRELNTLLRSIRKKVSSAMSAKNAIIPENVKSLLDAADKFANEYELSSTGEVHSIAEIQKLQEEFTTMFM